MTGGADTDGVRTLALQVVSVCCFLLWLVCGRCIGRLAIKISDVGGLRNCAAFTADGAAVNTCMANELEASFQWCVSHLLSLAVKAALSDPTACAADLLKKGRNIASSVNSSTCRVWELEHLVALGAALAADAYVPEAPFVAAQT